VEAAQHDHRLVTRGFVQKKSLRSCKDRPNGNELFDMSEKISGAKLCPPSVNETLPE
jgi:hypothetical protein